MFFFFPFANNSFAVTTDIEKSLLVDSEMYFIQMKTMNKNQTVYSIGDEGNALYIVSKGYVTLINTKDDDNNSNSNNGSNTFDENSDPNGIEANEMDLKIAPGFIFGDSNFLLGTPRTCSAVVLCNNTVLWKLSKTEYKRMEMERPDIHAVFQKILLRVLAHQLDWASTF